jgi:glyoxylase-like metal-dependent hydrolase (beta-lactamase superfamily II)
LYEVEKDKATVRASVRKLLELGAQRFYVGHGGPLSRAAVERWLSSQPQP